MIKFIEAKKNYIMALAVFFVIVSLSGTTYSLFIKTDTTDKFDYTTGLLDLAFTEDTPLTLNETFPVVDSVGSSSTPYTLTIKNTGNLYPADVILVFYSSSDLQVDSLADLCTLFGVASENDLPTYPVNGNCMDNIAFWIDSNGIRMDKIVTNSYYLSWSNFQFQNEGRFSDTVTRI